MNTKNKFMILTFAVLMLGHWLEHAFQAYQIYVMHMGRACALGMLGMKYPWLVKTEILHYGFAVFTTVGLWMLWDVFVKGKVASDYLVIDPTSRVWWKAAYYISIWHLFEHTLLIDQALTHHYFFGKTVPTSIIQLFVPRVELHLFYNSLVTIPIAIAMYQLWRNMRPAETISTISFNVPV